MFNVKIHRDLYIYIYIYTFYVNCKMFKKISFRFNKLTVSFVTYLIWQHIYIKSPKSTKVRVLQINIQYTSFQVCCEFDKIGIRSSIGTTDYGWLACALSNFNQQTNTCYLISRIYIFSYMIRQSFMHICCYSAVTFF